MLQGYSSSTTATGDISTTGTAYFTNDFYKARRYATSNARVKEERIYQRHGRGPKYRSYDEWFEWRRRCCQDFDLAVVLGAGILVIRYEGYILLFRKTVKGTCPPTRRSITGGRRK